MAEATQFNEAGESISFIQPSRSNILIYLMWYGTSAPKHILS